MKNSLYGIILLAALVIFSCKEGEREGHHDDDLHNELHFDSDSDDDEKSMAQQIKELKEGGFEIFDYVDEESGDTIIMQKYFMAFLKRGPNRDWTKQESDSIQALHMAHLTRMYEEGYADISGPFGDDQDVRGITIYNVPTFKMADSLANMDPSVQAGSLMIEVRPWWAGKGYPLR
ncbi:MAG: YciI family protein [Bacteroidota bacterium]